MQSPWFIDGQRKGESSVEEHIADAVLPHFKADKHKFMTAGRGSDGTEGQALQAQGFTQLSSVK